MELKKSSVVDSISCWFDAYAGAATTGDEAPATYCLRMFAITAFSHRYFVHRAFRTARASHSPPLNGFLQSRRQGHQLPDRQRPAAEVLMGSFRRRARWRNAPAVDS